MPVKMDEDVGEDTTIHITNGGGGKTIASGDTNTGSGHRKSKVGKLFWISSGKFQKIKCSSFVLPRLVIMNKNLE